MALFDVRTAEKYFWEIVGKAKENTLLKRMDKVEAQNLKGDSLVTHLTNKFNDIQINLDNDKLEKLLGNSGIVYLLSTKPHTTNNSNFVKLVKNEVVNNRALQNYFLNPSKEVPENIKNIRTSLVRYLKLTDDKENDEVPDSKTTETNQLKRNKNKDVAEKMQSHRKVNRLKVMTTALLIHLIESCEKKAEAVLRAAEEDLILRLSNGKATKEEFESLDKETLKKLSKIVIPKGAKIGEDAFKFCDNLTDLTISENVDISKNSFLGCTKLSKIVIGKGAKIGEFAFKSCDNLTDLTISENTDIGEGAFLRCKNLSKIVIPNGTKIGNRAFGVCDNLTDLTIMENIDICERSFLGCTKLSKIVIGKDAKIGEGAFKFCSNLTDVSISENVNVGQGAFLKCTGLSKIIIPKDSKVEERAFADCKNLTDLTIGENVDISKNSFLGCTKLSKIVIEKGAKIGEFAFKSCDNLTDLTISENTDIGEGAFLSCKNLSKIVIPNGTKIGNRAFNFCENLTEVTISEGVEIDKNAFVGCPQNMDIKGNASEETKNIIRKQISEPS